MYSRRNAVFTPRRRRRHWVRATGLTLLALVLVCAAYTAFDNGRVVVHTAYAVVHDLPSALEGFTVLHISDLNGQRFGPAQQEIENALRGCKYSAVCITGDMVGPKGDPYPFYELLSVLDLSKPVYFISGDSDPLAVGTGGGLSVLAEWVQGAEARGATFLGEPVMLAHGSGRVWFSDAAQLSLDMDGASDAYAASDTPVSRYYADVLYKTRQARAQMVTEDLHIALTHRPLSAEMSQMMLSIADTSGASAVRTVDLFLAGGTVGGQWRVPLVGGVWSDGWFPDDHQVAGMQRAGSLPQSQYISTGLGIDPENPLPSFRLFNTPSVTLITFTAHFMAD